MPDDSSYTLRRRNPERILQPELNAAKALVKSLTCAWHELQEWQMDNEYILTGYRRAQNHWKGCLESVYAYLHNETINIHTHLWGAVLFLYLCTTFYSSYIKPFTLLTTWRDSAVFLIFLLSAVLCLFASALFHTASCHSKEVSSRCHAFDYSGIIILTSGSTFSLVHYGLFCHSHLKFVYCTAYSLVAIGAAYVVLSPEYAKPTHRKARTRIFILLGLAAGAPVMHLLALYGAHELFKSMGFQWLLASGAFYICGALLYANRIPERLAPGKFDYFFASHQIFHVCVVCAALAHYRCLTTVFTYQFSAPQGCAV